MRGKVHICKSDKFVPVLQPVLLHMNFSVTLACEADYVIVTHRDIVRFICKSKKKVAPLNFARSKMLPSYARVSPEKIENCHMNLAELLLHMNLCRFLLLHMRTSALLHMNSVSFLLLHMNLTRSIVYIYKADGRIVYMAADKCAASFILLCAQSQDAPSLPLLVAASCSAAPNELP